MRRSLLHRIVVALLSLALHSAAWAAAPAMVLTIDGAIGPGSADYVRRGIAHAQQSGAQLVILEMDTPGGLDTAMRTIIKSILSSSIPVAAYVAPSGARAASAGTYIMYASHLAAMAPGTNLGAATPVRLGGSAGGEQDESQKPKQPAGSEKGSSNGTDKDSGSLPGKPSTEPMTRKQVNDAAAYIRGLAQLRGAAMPNGASRRYARRSACRQRRR